jgi:hypothetical protein
MNGTKFRIVGGGFRQILGWSCGMKLWNVPNLLLMPPVKSDDEGLYLPKTV